MRGLWGRIESVSGVERGGRWRAASQPGDWLVRNAVWIIIGRRGWLPIGISRFVAWVAVIGAANAQDVMAQFGVGRTVGYRRLREPARCLPRRPDRARESGRRPPFAATIRRARDAPIALDAAAFKTLKPVCWVVNATLLGA